MYLQSWEVVRGAALRNAPAPSCKYLSIYTPGIYADGYIVFAFPFVRSYVRSFVRSLVRFFVRNSGTFVEFMSKFWLKFL